MQKKNENASKVSTVVIITYNSSKAVKRCRRNSKSIYRRPKPIPCTLPLQCVIHVITSFSSSTSTRRLRNISLESNGTYEHTLRHFATNRETVSMNLVKHIPHRVSLHG